MIKFGDPNYSLTTQSNARQKREDALRESQIALNQRLTTYPTVEARKESNTIIHNHFNIIINVAPDTSQEKITSFVQKLTTIVRRVN